MISRFVRMFSLAAFMLTSINACHSEQAPLAQPEPLPGKFSQGEEIPPHAPIVKGNIENLPELNLGQKEEMKKVTTGGRTNAEIKPGAITVNNEEKRKKLAAATEENLALAEKIRKLELRLAEKELVSQKVSKKIESVKQKIDRSTSSK